jgi:hypothetical protein
VKAVALIAGVRLLLHCLTNVRYGFHRDELAVIDDARNLAWGYVAYPPLTPAVGRLMIELFGITTAGLRVGSALAQSVAMVLTALIVRDLGGSRKAQILAALAVAISPMSLVMGSMFQYISFDYLWWVSVGWMMVRLLRDDDPRWWLGIGAAIGLGMLTKYTMIFLVAAIVAAVLFTPLRRHLKRGWLWGGVALSLLVYLPNLIWQVQHDFVSLRFLDAIHSRDVLIGRTEGFISQQFFVSANPVTIPLWIAGLVSCVRHRRYRPVAFLYAVPFVLFLAARGRAYYLAPAYPVLFAIGAVVFDRWMVERHRRGWAAAWAAFVLGAFYAVPIMVPIAPVNSSLWHFTADVHDNFAEQIGWEEFVETVARTHRSLPPEERVRAGIVVANYGEAGALNLYGARYGLPRPISGVNSYWYRGYPDPPPQTLIVTGFRPDSVERHFTNCRPAGKITNRYGVMNEETRDHPEFFVCGPPRKAWAEFWRGFQQFG